jgi:hypothetical protein
MKGKHADINLAVLRKLWYNRKVSMHDLALKYLCTLGAVRKAARLAGLPPRSTIMPEHPPLYEVYQGQGELEAQVKRRARMVRRGWTSDEEYSRRVTKCRVGVSITCLSNTGDASTFKPVPVPGYMTAPLRTKEEVYRDRKEGSAA